MERGASELREVNVSGEVRAVYIAGPYKAATPEEIERNVRRACAVGFFAATVHGLSPTVPHAESWLGVLGSPLEADGELTRSRALRVTTAKAAQIGRAGGDLWVIAREDGTLSEGTQLDLEAFRSQGVTSSQSILVKPWSGWARTLRVSLPRGPVAEMHLAWCTDSDNV